MRLKKQFLALITFIIGGTFLIALLHLGSSREASNDPFVEEQETLVSPKSIAWSGQQNAVHAQRSAPLPIAGNSPELSLPATNHPAKELAVPWQEGAIAEFHAWADQYSEQPGGLQPDPEIERGKMLALAHRKALKVLIRKDPKRALEEAVPLVLRHRLPSEITVLLEERIYLRADFNVYATPPGDGAEPIRRMVETDTSRYKAFVYGRRLAQPTTPDDWIAGIAIDNAIAVSKQPLPFLADDEHLTVPAAPYEVAGEGYVAAEGGTGGPTYPLYPINSTATTGGRSVLYLRVSFPDILREPQTETAAYSMMNSVNDWFIESSYGKLFLLTTVAPLVVVPNGEAWYTGGDADEYDLLGDASATAAAMGYDPEQFDHVILAYRGGPGAFAGLGNIGGKNVWLKNGGITIGTAAHELAHNFGLWHANLWKTIDFSVIGDGSNQEYDNHYDTMGESNPVK